MNKTPKTTDVDNVTKLSDNKYTVRITKTIQEYEYEPYTIDVGCELNGDINDAVNEYKRIKSFINKAIKSRVHNKEGSYNDETSN